LDDPDEALGGVDVADDREEVDVELDALPDALELLGQSAGAEEPAEVASGLAGGDEHTGFPEHRLELLDQVVDRRVLPQLHQPQDALDRAGIGGQLAALALVPPDHLRPLGDHGDEAERVHAGELGHGGDGIYLAPWHCALPL